MIQPTSPPPCRPTDGATALSSALDGRPTDPSAALGIELHGAQHNASLLDVLRELRFDIAIFGIGLAATASTVLLASRANRAHKRRHTRSPFHEGGHDFTRQDAEQPALKCGEVGALLLGTATVLANICFCRLARQRALVFKPTDSGLDTTTGEAAQLHMIAHLAIGATLLPLVLSAAPLSLLLGSNRRLLNAGNFRAAPCTYVTVLVASIPNLSVLRMLPWRWPVHHYDGLPSSRVLGFAFAQALLGDVALLAVQLYALLTCPRELREDAPAALVVTALALVLVTASLFWRGLRKLGIMLCVRPVFYPPSLSFASHGQQSRSHLYAGGVSASSVASFSPRSLQTPDSLRSSSALARSGPPSPRDSLSFASEAMDNDVLHQRCVASHDAKQAPRPMQSPQQRPPVGCPPAGTFVLTRGHELASVDAGVKNAKGAKGTSSLESSASKSLNPALKRARCAREKAMQMVIKRRSAHGTNVSSKPCFSSDKQEPTVDMTAFVVATSNKGADGNSTATEQPEVPALTLRHLHHSLSDEINSEGGALPAQTRPSASRLALRRPQRRVASSTTTAIRHERVPTLLAHWQLAGEISTSSEPTTALGTPCSQCVSPRASSYVSPRTPRTPRTPPSINRDLTLSAETSEEPSEDVHGHDEVPSTSSYDSSSAEVLSGDINDSDAHDSVDDRGSGRDGGGLDSYQTSQLGALERATQPGSLGTWPCAEADSPSREAMNSARAEAAHATTACSEGSGQAEAILPTYMQAAVPNGTHSSRQRQAGQIVEGAVESPSHEIASETVNDEHGDDELFI